MSAPVFMNRVMAAVQVAEPLWKLYRRGDLEFDFTPPGLESQKAWLRNSYDRYRFAPHTLDRVVEEFVAAMVESVRMLDTREIDVSRIVPVVKHRSWIEQEMVAPDRGRKQPAPVWEPFLSDLIVTYAEDTETSMRYLSTDDVKRLGIRPEELRERAVRNLMAILPSIEVHRGELLSAIRAGGNYEASLLLVDAIWDGGKLGVDGDVVVAVPARGMLLYASAKNAAGIEWLKEAAKRIAAKAPYPLTNTLFARRGDEFRPIDS